MIATKYGFCMIFGYLLGSINPSALIGKLKKTNLRESGTGNLGATNVTLLFGKALGAWVMAFDMLKAIAAVKLAESVFPLLSFAGLVAGTGAVVGHIFPFYLKFKGGKGLASFGGLVLAVNPIIFVFLLILGLILMFVFNYSAALMTSAAILFPILGALSEHSLVFFIIAASVSGVMIWRFRENFQRIRRGEEITVKQMIEEKLKKHPKEN